MLFHADQSCSWKSWWKRPSAKNTQPLFIIIRNRVLVLCRCRQFPECFELHINLRRAKKFLFKKVSSKHVLQVPTKWRIRADATFLCIAARVKVLLVKKKQKTILEVVQVLHKLVEVQLHLYVARAFWIWSSTNNWPVACRARCLVVWLCHLCDLLTITVRDKPTAWLVM